MPSPFPGMDPYLERKWTNFHSTLITYIRDALNAGLPAGLAADMEEYVAVDAAEGERWTRVPDVHVTRDDEGWQDSGGGVAVAEEVAVAQPLLVEQLGEPWQQKYIRIVDSEGERLVTVIELLSPSNKQDAGMVEYKKKRQEVLRGGAHLVEIDLCRQGDWRRLLWPASLPEGAASEYRIITRRVRLTHILEVYPITLRQRLPRFPIPLRETDPDLPLDLQPLLDRAYVNGRFDRLDYARPLYPPLEGDDAAWAAELLRERGASPAAEGVTAAAG